MKLERFFNEDFNQFALYDIIRSIASYIDGLKPSSRKVVYTLKEDNVKDKIKVSILAADVSRKTQYLHGVVSLEGVIVRMAQNFVGSNNINLLSPDGAFGNRTIPKAAASRYIQSRKSEWLDKIFVKDDDAVLIKQNFEGEEIEPRFYVPTLPLILVNGSEGIGSGYAQKILARHPKDIEKAIAEYLKTGKLPKKISPGFVDFKGAVTQFDDNKVEIYGHIEIVDGTTLHVTELPPSYDMAYYNKVLATLVEKRVIKSFTDKSNKNNFSFIIKCERTFSKLEEYDMYDKLKLVDRITENFTCIDENNSIKLFDSEIDLLKEFIDFKLKYYEKRKEFLLKKMASELTVYEERMRFIKMVINGDIIINAKTKDNIESQLESNKFKKVNGGKYEYLLGMQLYSLTKEKIESLRELVENKKNSISELKGQSPNDLFDEDLKNVR